MFKTRGKTGLTYLEIAVTVALFSVAMIITLAFMKSSFEGYDVQKTNCDSQRAAQQVLERIAIELRPAKVVGAIPADGASIVMQVPVDPQGDGVVVDANGAIEWGAPEDTGDVVGSAITYRFVQTGTLRESADGRDYNGNGRMTDSFAVGHVARTTTRGRTTKLGEGAVVQPLGALGGDVDGDGSPDPIFSQNGDLVAVNLWTLRSGLNKETFMTQAATTVRLRNPQQ